MEVIDRLPNTKGLQLSNNVDEKHRRPPFTHEQLQAIVTSDEMRRVAKDGAIYFWCFVIGLYHGFRLNEIASLPSSAITRKNGVDVIEIKTPREIIQRERKGRSKVVPRPTAIQSSC